ncbi:DUF1294 domain-containing protein [Turicibacter sanguinis]|uniref:DUF1294 domain-containing protein n=2 Tax=Turicibacter sanguinis TaxID=154288 RepID=A0A9X5API9_9FIRM|nr:DUF1294 domain-containing protein [Turicibacter sanguinis]EFF62920.1 conserved hypothetical protein [Turicibacter sanguinis PC909]MCU7202344.1 DUF1294 domain-containing protein [Turicibacter sanguinis]MTK21705.1 DUF1294 domain-containing protein [Turicibacter sanguinis]MTK71830.1 DUF1294 domain-containing protein [Turicibacter sanguinis]
MLILLIILNLISFTLMYVDKQKAIKGEWRISEKTLFLSAACFGAYGMWLGMNQFHHKTKHVNFRVFIPLLMIIESVILFVVYTKGWF